MVNHPASELVPDPPEPFAPKVVPLLPGAKLYRVGSTQRPLTAFNPGVGGRTRFAFFGDPTVPVLYAAETEIAAVAETLLHDIPAEGGELPFSAYCGRVLGRLTVTRPLRLAAFTGLGLRQLKVTADQVTTTPAAAYPRTVAWARAVHGVVDDDGPLDGMVWMARLCNDNHSYVFFGDRCADAFELDPTFGRILEAGSDRGWLVDLCAPLHINVLPPGPHGQDSNLT